MPDKLRVFVSSRIRGNEGWRDNIARVLTDVGHEAVLLPEGESRSTNPRDYMGQLDDCEIVIFLVDKQSDAVEAEISAAIDDGKPIIMLTHAPRVDGLFRLTRYAKSLQDHSPVMVRPFDNEELLLRLVVLSVETVIARRFHEPRLPIEWGGRIYQNLAHLMRQANRRVALTQESSSLILGPRNRRAVDEKKFLEEFYNVVDRLNRNPHLNVIHLFDIEATTHTLRKQANLYPKHKHYTELLLETLAADTTGRFSVKGVPPRISPIMIADDMMLLGHHIGPNQQRGSFHEQVGEWATDTWANVIEARDAEDAQEVVAFLADVVDE